MKTFAAIDFETANYLRSSVCSVGIVVVRNGKVAEKFYRLIRPCPNRYSWFTNIHGLSDADTCNAPDFPAVWAEMAPKIVGLPLVAHNSPFDESCLRAAHEAYGMPYPDYVFCCTRLASRRMFGSALPDYHLDTVAAHCGFDLQNHHNALADAEACAAIAVRVLAQKL
jgi:DNA polymerase-3 subunit epsilon